MILFEKKQKSNAHQQLSPYPVLLGNKSEIQTVLKCSLSNDSSLPTPITQWEISWNFAHVPSRMRTAGGEMWSKMYLDLSRRGSRSADFRVRTKHERTQTNWHSQGEDCNLVVLFCWTIISLGGNLVLIKLNSAAWLVCSLQSTLSSPAVYKGEQFTQPTGVSVHHLKTQKSLVFTLTVTQLQWSWDCSFNNGCKIGDFQHLSRKQVLGTYRKGYGLVSLTAQCAQDFSGCARPITLTDDPSYLCLPQWETTPLRVSFALPPPPGLSLTFSQSL